MTASRSVVRVNDAGQRWLRSGAPEDAAAPRSSDASWPLHVGAVCDVALTPVDLGRETIRQASYHSGLGLGPSWESLGQRIGFALQPGSSADLALLLPSSSQVTIPTRGNVCQVPPPLLVSSGSHAAPAWLITPDADPPRLPGPGAFAHLVRAALRSLTLTRRGWHGL